MFKIRDEKETSGRGHVIFDLEQEKFYDVQRIISMYSVVVFRSQNENTQTREVDWNKYIRTNIQNTGVIKQLGMSFQDCQASWWLSLRVSSRVGIYWGGIVHYHVGRSHNIQDIIINPASWWCPVTTQDGRVHYQKCEAQGY